MSENYTSPRASFDFVDNITPDRLVIEPGWADVIVIPAGSGLVKRGTVIGKITASRKYVMAKKAATDGSAVADRIVADTVDAGTDVNGADVQTVAYRTGRYNTNSLIVDDSVALDDVRDQLRGKGIHLETSLT